MNKVVELDQCYTEKLRLKTHKKVINRYKI